MHNLSAWFVRNPVAANLLMLLILVAGIFTITTMRIESFPRIPPRSINISVIYPGATATQVDEGVTQKIEQALEGMPGIKRTYSFSYENLATVMVEKNSGYDLQTLLEDARTRIDGIVGMPMNAERPTITRDEFQIFGLIVQIAGDVDENTLQSCARLVEDELLSNPKISNLQIFGKRPYEVSVEVDNAKLQGYGLTIDDVRNAVAANSIEYRSGILESGGQRILLRTEDKAYYNEDFADIPVMALPDGGYLNLADIASINDAFEEQFIVARYNGKPSVGIIINTDNKSNLLLVREAVDDVLNKLETQLPESIQLEVWADSSEYIKDRLDLLGTNAWQGLLIIIVLLTLFLDFKLAFWVAVGIPVSIAGTFALMGDWFIGYSLNDITTFGIIIVLGILVDDAIVVGESIYEARRRIKNPLDSAIAGVNRVAKATIFGAFTTIAAFFPLLIIDNDIAKIFAGFSVVVIVAVAVSLVESKFILPAHLAEIHDKKNASRNKFLIFWSSLREKIDTFVQKVIHQYYKPALSWTISNRYAALIFLLTVAVLGIGLMGTGVIKMVFFPEVPGNTIMVSYSMDQSSPESLTRLNSIHLEDAAYKANQELVDEYKLKSDPISKLMVVVVGRLDVEAYGELSKEAMDKVGTNAVLARWREATGELEGVSELEFTGSLETAGGFVLQVFGKDENLVAAAVDDINAELESLKGVNDVRSDLKGGQPEFRLKLKPEARHLGFTLHDLATQIGDGFGGYEVQRMQRGEDEVKVFVRYEKNKRQSLHEILNSRVFMPSGNWITLESIAEFESGYDFGSVNRRNGKRTATIRASIDKRLTGSAAVMASLKEDINQVEKRYPGIEVMASGELEEMGEVQSGMKKAFLFIALLIYALLAIPLKSYTKPFIIMSVVPFGFVGAAFGHMILNLPLSILSFFGMLAATGVVVNDSLVLVTRFVQLREEGIPVKEALLEAGCSRFRAIFLTTATTVCGLMPLISETSEQAQYLIPAAVSLAFAELLATPVTLFIVPVALSFLHDIEEWFRKIFHRRESTDRVSLEAGIEKS